ncbi:hypothetical protein [Micromonospora terminaliae]|uniref:hypothetical protein n=1 Tax=Micromonospora terminaliae TaxID=1914461 RepID=UPI00195464AE|nr:hypothetical protein [Micromonospora terminaliae]
MENGKILRDYRGATHTLADAASGIANLHNITLAALNDARLAAGGCSTSTVRV